jgi:hypothetical protein
MKCKAFEIVLENDEFTLEIDSADVKFDSPRKKALTDLVELITIEFVTNVDEVLESFAKIYEPTGWRLSLRCKGEEEPQEYDNIRFAGVTIDSNYVHGEAKVILELAIVNFA